MTIQVIDIIRVMAESSSAIGLHIKTKIKQIYQDRQPSSLFVLAQSRLRGTISITQQIVGTSRGSRLAISSIVLIWLGMGLLTFTGSAWAQTVELEVCGFNAVLINGECTPLMFKSIEPNSFAIGTLSPGAADKLSPMPDYRENLKRAYLCGQLAEQRFWAAAIGRDDLAPRAQPMCQDIENAIR